MGGNVSLPVIRRLYVLKPTGVWFFEKHFGGDKKGSDRFHDSGLVASFLSAAQTFVKETAGAQIRLMLLDETALVFHQTCGGFQVVLFCDGFDVFHHAGELLRSAKALGEQFEKMFPDASTRDAVCCKEYEGFEPVARREVERFARATAKNVEVLPAFFETLRG
ncbi:MAG: hypothetical protein Kow0069_35760 [Promethearchaeota archaeon]